jgi:hypothetical protein
MPATWMSIEPVLMIWSSGRAALAVEAGPPTVGFWPGCRAGPDVAAAVGPANAAPPSLNAALAAGAAVAASP